MYADKVIKMFKDPKHVGKMKEYSAVGEVGNAKCGDIMKLYIKVKDDVITDISFHTFGCVTAIASTEALCQIVKGKTIEEALKITKQDVIEHMGGDVPAIKVHCSVLATEALEKAIENYKKG